MTPPGRFLERPALIPVGEEVLEGLAHGGEKRPPVLIVPPPPEEGPGMDHPVAAELAWKVATSGFATLRFNFRGTGASQGQKGDKRTRVTDAEAALRVLMENTGVVTVAAVSIGSSAQTAIELQRLHPAVSALCFIRPIGVDSSDMARLHPPLLVLVSAADSAQPKATLAASVTQAGGRLVVVEETDPALTRNLSEVAREVSHWLTEIGES